MTLTPELARTILARLPDDIALLPLVLTGNGGGGDTVRATPGSRQDRTRTRTATRGHPAMTTTTDPNRCSRCDGCGREHEEGVK